MRPDMLTIGRRPRTLRDTVLKGKVVVVESPYAGNVERNVAYLHGVMCALFRAGAIPFASHGIYPGPLADADPVERAAGIQAGYEIGKRAADVVLYAMDFGISSGMIHSVPVWLNHQAENPAFVVDVMAFGPTVNLQEWEIQLLENVQDEYEPRRVDCTVCRGQGLVSPAEYEIATCETCLGVGTVRHWMRRK